MQKQPVSEAKKSKDFYDIITLLPAKNTSKKLKTEMLRVDHAGEFGAVHIYKGQAQVFQSTPTKRDVLNQIQEMGEQEKVHLDKFNNVLVERRIRPSILSPFWQTGGFFLGAVTALISPESAMACTEAVETVVDKHYDTQIVYFENQTEPDILLPDLKKFQQDELDHKQEAIDSDSKNAPFYKTTKFLIETLSHIVIKLAHQV